MQTQMSLQEMSDLDLILKYKKNYDGEASKILLNKYKGIIYKYALDTFKQVSADFSVEVDDLAKDFEEQCLIAFQKVNPKKLKKENKFSTIGIILKRFNSYKKVIKHRYQQDCIHEFYEKYRNEPRTVNSYNSINKVQIDHNRRNKTYTVKNTDHSIEVSIKEFKYNLRIPIEIKCFDLLQKGYKGFEIAKKLGVSDSTISHIKNDLKKKFIEFMQLKGEIR